MSVFSIYELAGGDAFGEMSALLWQYVEDLNTAADPVIDVAAGFETWVETNLRP